MKKFLCFMYFMVVSTILFAQDKNFHIYLCFGQSNMEGNAPVEPQDTCNINERFLMMAGVNCSDLGRVKGNWYKAVPPLARCYTGLTPADYFGRTLLEYLPSEVRVGVINVSVGGCSIDLFDKERFKEYITAGPDWLKNIVREYDDNPYGRLVELARLAQGQGIIKGILLHQGESNSGDRTWPERAKKVYGDLLRDLKLESEQVPLIVGEMVHTDQNGQCASMNEIINTLPQVIPAARVVSSAGCPAADDHLHFTAEGYRILGKRYAIQMLEAMGIR